VLVWSGILATLAANVIYGAQYGLLGALIWGWPAYSFILAAGGMVVVVKRGAVAGGPETAPDGPWQAVPTGAQNAALIAMKATIAAGNPLSGRQLEARFGLSRAEATKVRQAVLASANGQHPHDPGEDAPGN
jgi:hypothetical protein